MMLKPLLIFVHGMFCHSGVWNQMVDYFKARGYDCLAIDLPYHDQAPHLDPDPNLGTTSVSDYVEFVQEVTRKIDREFILIGHSMGGLITMITASLPDIRPKAIVLLAPAAPWGIWSMYPQVIWAFEKILLSYDSDFFWKRPIKMDFERLSAAMFNHLPPEMHQPLYDTLVHESGKAAFELGMWYLDRWKATAFNARGITCPVAIFIGDDDQTTPLPAVINVGRKLSLPTISERIYYRLCLTLGKKDCLHLADHVHLVVLPDTGHWLPLALPHDVLLAMIERLSLASNLRCFP